MTKTAAAVAVLTLLFAAPILAQSSPFIGAHVAGASLTHATEQGATHPVEFGSGFGMHAGVSFGDRFGMLVSFDRSIHGVKTGDTDLGQLDILGRMSCIDVGSAKAYLTAGLSREGASKASSSDFPFGRLSPTAGVTGQLPLSSRLAVDAGVLWTFGTFKDSQGNGAPLVQRAFLGASYYLFGRK